MVFWRALGQLVKQPSPMAEHFATPIEARYSGAGSSIERIRAALARHAEPRSVDMNADASDDDDDDVNVCLSVTREAVASDPWLVGDLHGATEQDWLNALNADVRIIILVDPQDQTQSMAVAVRRFDPTYIVNVSERFHTYEWLLEALIHADANSESAFDLEQILLNTASHIVDVYKSRCDLKSESK